MCTIQQDIRCARYSKINAVHEYNNTLAGHECSKKKTVHEYMRAIHHTAQYTNRAVGMWRGGGKRWKKDG